MIENPNDQYRIMTKDNKDYLKVGFRIPIKKDATENQIMIETKFLQYIVDLTLVEMNKTPGMYPCADLRLEYISSGNQLIKVSAPWMFGFSYLFYRRLRLKKQNTRIRAFFKSSALFSIAFFGLVAVTNITNFDAKNDYIENRLCNDVPKEKIKEVKERFNNSII